MLCYNSSRLHASLFYSSLFSLWKSPSFLYTRRLVTPRHTIRFSVPSPQKPLEAWIYNIKQLWLLCYSQTPSSAFPTSSSWLIYLTSFPYTHLFHSLLLMLKRPSFIYWEEEKALTPHSYMVTSNWILFPHICTSHCATLRPLGLSEILLIFHCFPIWSSLDGCFQFPLIHHCSSYPCTFDHIILSVLESPSKPLITYAIFKRDALAICLDSLPPPSCTKVLCCTFFCVPTKSIFNIWHCIFT